MKIIKTLGMSGVASKTVLIPKIILDEWKNEDNWNTNQIILKLEDGKLIIEPLIKEE